MTSVLKYLIDIIYSISLIFSQTNASKDFTDVTLAIGDTYRDDVRSGRQVGRHIELKHLSAKSFNNASSANCWPNLQLMQVAPPGGQIFN